MTKFNVVVLASGLSTRLKPITNHIPKCLVNVGNKTALLMQYEYWSSYHDFHKMYVVVHSQFKPVVEGYLKVFDLDDKIRIITKDESYGSYEAILSITSLYPQLQVNTFWNWSDVIPVSPISIKPSINNIFTNHGNHRFRVDSWTGINEVQCDGNVPGLYYLNDVRTLLGNAVPKHGDDVISHFGEHYDFQPIAEIIDFGDMPKMKSLSNGPVTREFNEVEIKDGVVEKKALNDQGYLLQARELAWYDKVKTNNVPDILVKKPLSFVMSIAPGIEAYKTPHVSPDLILGELNKIHQSETISVTSDTLGRDINIEASVKVYNRINTIQPIIDGFGKVKTVNDLKLKTPNEIIDELRLRISSLNYGKDQYSLIHGDPNFSNIFINKNKVTFIDPRGYFGETELYGLPSYDRAKVLYALSGYDNFNADPLFGNFVKDGNDLDIYVEPYSKSFMNLDSFFTEEEYYWLAIIWISLGGYFKNNPLKATTAYYYGLYLGQKILGKY